MHLEVLVEEQSAEEALRVLLPRMLPGEVTFEIRTFQGKRDLLRKLPDRLNGYRSWLPPDWRIVVLVDEDRDEDRQDCHALKAELENAARQAGFVTSGSQHYPADYEVLNRIAVEELEAWFFGDVQALVSAYPRIPPSLGEQARYRDPDAIRGGTWENLERVLQKAGYYKGGMPKIKVARRISEHMDPVQNRSRSFQVFCSGITALTQRG